MKYINKCFVAMLITATLFGNPKVLAWWNLIFPVEYVTEEAHDTEIKFFFIEWLKSIRSCKK